MLSITNNLHKNILDAISINVLTCKTDFTIDYANKKSIDILNELTDLLPPGVNGDTIIGQSIDVFHKNPAHQRKLLSNPANFPYNTVIALGDQSLDLNVEVIMSGNKISKYVLAWSVCTERERLRTMVDNMPINVLMADPKTFTINYSNQTSKNTLKSIEHLLPIKLSQLDGICIDVFHKDPQRIRNILKDPSNLPHNAKIKLGDETLQLDVSAIMDRNNNYMGPMVAWSVITAQENLSNNVLDVTEEVNKTAGELEITAQTLSKCAEQTSHQAQTVAAAAEEASANVQTVASAAEEMSASINEISSQIANANRISSEAVEKAEGTNTIVQQLSQATQNIGDVVNLINDIAEQTNLLALNATIEAARAGDAGKGFSVVASEVKSLAAQTSKATDDIAEQIMSMQKTAEQAVGAISEIRETVNAIGETSSAISASIEEQASTTKEIARNVQEASAGTSEVSSNIAGVQQAASETGSASSQLLTLSGTLSGSSKNMSEEVKRFIG